jgi:hypothetical protein
MTKNRSSKAFFLATAAGGIVLAPTAPAQAQPVSTAQATPSDTTPAVQQPAPATEEELYGEGGEIVVTGVRRGTVIGDIPPENQLGPADIRATGATSITELLDALSPQIGSARGRGGEQPVLLLNGQRISSFRELRDLPPEAIERVDILPEEVALKYGYRADQRVVNFVLRPRFRSTATRIEGRVPTEGGYVAGTGEATQLRINDNGRTTVTLRAEGNSSITEAERDIALQDPAAPDERAARTLVASRRLVRGGTTVNRTILGNVSATLNTEVEHSDGRSLIGLSDFALEPLARNTDSNSAHLGFTLNGDKGRWRWSATGNGDVARNETRSEREDETRSDRAVSRTTSGNVDLMANGPLLALPAGEASVTLRAGVSALGLDSTRRRANLVSENELSRTRGNASINLDLPVSRRNKDFSALGNLTLNANAEIERFSDFGTLTTVGGGMNWSPLERLNLLASWTREEGAPSVSHLGDPILETPGTRVFDFTRGQTVEVTAITGGNPDLLADRRNVVKIGGNWKPFEQTDLRLRGEYVRSRLDNPVSSFPGPSATLQAAFPERFVRDASGQLVSVDFRPVNYDSARRDTLRWGFDFSKPLKSSPPSRAAIEEFRRRALARSGQSAAPAPESPPPEGAPPPGAAEGGPPPGGGGGGFGQGGGGGRGFGGRFFGGGGRNSGRLQFSLTHTINLVDEVTIRPGLPKLDYLHGEALGSTGGRPRHQVEAQAGYFNNGLGARLSANWRSGTRVESTTGDDLRFSPFGSFDLQLFANLGQRFDLVAKHPWLRGSSVRLAVDNLFDSRPKVRNAAGGVPFTYQPDLLDPIGRTVSISIRKLFLPPPRFFRQQRRP